MGPQGMMMGTGWALLVGALAVGASMFLLAWRVARVLLADRGDDARREAFETTRRLRLRSQSRCYRWFEPLVVDMARAIEANPVRPTESITRSLATLAEDSGWTSAEWLAASRLGAAAWAAGPGLAIGWVLGQLTTLAVVPAVIIAAYSWKVFQARRSLELRAAAARSRIRQTLPFSIDLIVLMLQAGSTFREAIETLARYSSADLWKKHLGLFLRDLDRGLPRVPALGQLGQRLGMEEVDSLVFAVKQGETLGTSLTQVLASQSQQLRFRQAQAIERAAEQVKVRFVVPSTIAMVASMMTMLAPLLVGLGDQFQGTEW